jgi:hypothetical protein
MPASAVTTLPLVNVPNDRAAFTQYCLRRLGSPVIKINVSDEQVQDRINDALLLFWDYHFEGSEKLYYKYQVTQNDVDNGYITLPDNIIGAVQVFGGGAFESTNMFSYRYQFSLNDLYPLTMGSVLTYYMTMQYLEFLESIFVTKTPIRYNRYGNLLYIDDWSQYPAGSWLVVEAYQIVNPTLHSQVWRDRFLGQLATALIKRQWGENLKKYRGVQMPGGIEFNGQEIWNEAENEIKSIKDELINTYSIPASDFIG